MMADRLEPSTPAVDRTQAPPGAATQGTVTPATLTPAPAALRTPGTPLDACSICFESLTCTPARKHTLRTCGHRFHKTCIRRWAEHSAARMGDGQPMCPMCRQQLPLDDSPFENMTVVAPEAVPRYEVNYPPVRSSAVMHRAHVMREAVRRANEARAAAAAQASAQLAAQQVA
ncbi:unnamed protein product [Pedinophyceae sp. YPF-701]|nr:unnamed protein product [Pedinophyceae sp. YPF-701]